MIRKIIALFLIFVAAIIGVSAFLWAISNAEFTWTKSKSEESIQSVIVITLQVDNPVMFINGKEQYIDANERSTVPLIQNGRALIPIRAVVEAMGGTVGWDAVAKTVVLTHGNDIIKLTIGSDTAYINETAQTLDTAPIIIKDVTMLPIRFVAESFGFKVDWDAASSKITIIGSSFQQAA